MLSFGLSDAMGADSSSWKVNASSAARPPRSSVTKVGIQQGREGENRRGTGLPFLDLYLAAVARSEG